jgi:hypothetical protein
MMQIARELSLMLLTVALLALQPLTAQADPPAVCTTTSEGSHVISQACSDGTTQIVTSPSGPGASSAPLTVESSDGRMNTGTLSGPWFLWTDSAGNQCATGAVVSQKLEFYPISCPPSGQSTIS